MWGGGGEEEGGGLMFEAKSASFRIVEWRIQSFGYPSIFPLPAYPAQECRSYRAGWMPKHLKKKHTCPTPS